jgi:uncharacterized lipoprotein YajG
MKKLLLILITSLSLSACATNKVENLNFRLSLDSDSSNIGNNKKVEVVVIDERTDSETLGQKRVGKYFVTIKSNQNLVDLIQDQVNHGLAQKGFSRGFDKTLEIRLVNLDYNANRGVFKGHSKASVLLRVAVKDKFNISKKYQRNYGLTIDKDHFIAPLLTTDEQSINFVLQETLNDLLRDQDLMETLKL